jgi:paraquat-inducible protein B
MTTSHPNTPQQAKITKGKAISAIWLIPFVALCIGAWMVYHQWQSQGVMITVEMISAKGLEVDKTKVKTRNVDIGIVKSITLKKDLDGVLVSIEIDKEVAHLLTENTQIWIVSPRISTKGISGLTTILSGIYIELAPGDSKKAQDYFTALENPPITPAGTPGLHITLSGQDDTAYSVGDTVVYKGLTVGRFEDVYFNVEQKRVHYNVFIKAPYHQLITKNTRFWNVSGLRIDLSANGINVETGSIQSLMSNSVTFGELKGLPATAIEGRSYFDIYHDQKSAISPHYKYSSEYIILISDTVRGLDIGAPVEYRGINIGEVLAINYHPNGKKPLMDQDYKIPVLVSIQAGKIGLNDTQDAIDEITQKHGSWIEQGLRANLQSGNLLTGKLFVNLQHYSDEAPLEISYFENYPIIPSVLDNFSLLAQSSEQLLDKLNKLPLEDLTANATVMFQSFNEAARSLKSASHNLEILLSDVNKQQLINNINAMLESTSKFADTYAAGSPSNERILASLNNLNAMMTSIETLADNYAEGSEADETLKQTLQGFNNLVREIQPLLLELNQQPNSLIFSGDQPPNIQPKARK